MFIGPGRTVLVIVRTRRARGPCFTVIGAGWPRLVIIPIRSAIPAIIIAIVTALIAIVIIAIATQSVHELLAASLHVLLQGLTEILKSLRLGRPCRRKRHECSQSHDQSRHFQNFKSAVLHSYLSSLFRLS